MIKLNDKYFEEFLKNDELTRIVENLIIDIKKSYQDQSNLAVIGILNGGVPLFTKIVFELDENIVTDFIKVSSYGNSTVSSGKVNIILDTQIDISGMDVLLIDDIYDTGLTMEFIKKNVLTKGAKTVRSCCLFTKEGQPNEPDFSGMKIREEFIVGFGLDYAQRGRNMNRILTLKK